MLQKLFGTGKPSTLVEAAFRDVGGMLEQAGRMFDLALEALLDNRELDGDLEADLDRMDDVVDEGERMVRRTILEHMSVNPRQDLVASLILMSMVQDAERIGDFARGLAQVVALAGSPRGGDFARDLRGIADRIRPHFALCNEAFRQDDSEKARRVLSAHAAIKHDCIACTRRVAASDLSADMAIVYAQTSQILRRISAHLANIASTVVQPFDRIRHGDEDA